MFQRFKEMFMDDQSGCMSHTKFWSNIASAAATGVFIKQGIAGTLTEGIWMIFLGTLCGHTLASKAVALKWGVKDPQGDTQ